MIVGGPKFYGHLYLQIEARAPLWPAYIPDHCDNNRTIRYWVPNRRGDANFIWYLVWLGREQISTDSPQTQATIMRKLYTFQNYSRKGTQVYYE